MSLSINQLTQSKVLKSCPSLYRDRQTHAINEIRYLPPFSIFGLTEWPTTDWWMDRQCVRGFSYNISDIWCTHIHTSALMYYASGCLQKSSRCVCVDKFNWLWAHTCATKCLSFLPPDRHKEMLFPDNNEMLRVNAKSGFARQRGSRERCDFFSRQNKDAI